MGEEAKPEGCGREELSGIEQARLNLLEAKERFIMASNALDPLEFVKDRPLISTGGAFLLGFALTTLSRQLALAQFLPLLLQVTESASRLLMNFRKN